MSGLEEIRNKLNEFKRKYYQRQLAVGIFLFLIVNGLLFLGISSIEHQLWLGVVGRAILFFGFVAILIATLSLFIIVPLLKHYNFGKQLSDVEAAKEISRFFPEIEDKLINTLELGDQDQNELIAAAIDKKSLTLGKLSFLQAVDFTPVKKHGYLLIAVIAGLLSVSFINPELLTDSPKRIANFHTAYEPNAPFRFILENESLNSFKGEDFTLSVRLDGNALPQTATLFVDNQPLIRPIDLKNGQLVYQITNIQEDKAIQIEAAGFRSPAYRIDVNSRPDLVSMVIDVAPPAYTGIERNTITNSGNLSIIEGSTVLWEMSTLATDSLRFHINDDQQKVSKMSQRSFIVEKQIRNKGIYAINLFNEYSQNKSELVYEIEVIKDEYPEIVTQYFLDSLTFQSLTIAGSISDDYGISGLSLNYQIENQEKVHRIPLKVSKQSGNQSYFATWNLDTLNLLSGASVDVYLSVFDNDGIKGPKESRSQTFTIQAPDENDIDALISEKQDNVSDKLNSSEERAEDIANRLEALEERLKSEQRFDWQEKKLLDDVIEDREKLTKEIEELQKQHEELLKSNERFQKQSEQLQEKNNKMQELLDQLMDEKTRELYEKLKELMKENAPSDQVTEQLNDLKKSERNLERDLERAVELFKRLKMESVLEQNLQKLDSLGTDQQKLADEPSNKESQEDLNKEFDEFREKMDEIQEMNQELKRPEPMEDFELEERQIAKELREILEQMEQEENQGENSEEQQNGEGEQNQEKNQQNKQSPSNTKQKQQNAAQRMKNLSKKLTNMQGGMQMEMMQANLDQLRDILDNLVKLSFNQEEIMMEMREVSQSDPRFLELSQNQLKLKDDAKVIQDSLLSLASKVVQLSTYVTREVESINENIDESIEFLKDRNRNRALSSQQSQ